MTYKEIVDKTKPEFEKSLKFLEQELAKIRTSRASPSLVEDIEVNAFGSKFALKQLAAISVPQTNQIVVQPWDNSYIEPIQKAIFQSGLGISCVVDKNLIRLTLPLITEEYKQSLIRLLNEKAEQARQAIRRQRDDAWNKIQAAEREKQISEDDKYRGKDELQKLVDDYQEKIKSLVERKKNELV